MTNADSHRRSIDLFNARDWDAAAAELAPDCEFVDQARSVTAKGRQQCLEYMQGWVTAFPDGQITSPRITDAGSRTVSQHIGSGTNDGPLGPLPASGRQVSLPFCEVREYDADGKVIGAELYYDQVTMLVQLGHMAPPEG
jgi:steroid delta-isomerase-like uncharacterized protein